MQPARVVDYLVYVAVRLLICVVQAIPLETGVRMARGLAWLMANVVRLRGEVVDENLRHAFAGLSGEQRRRLTNRMWDHLFLLVMEVSHAPRKIHETNWRRYVRLKNIAPLVAETFSSRVTILEGVAAENHSGQLPGPNVAASPVRYGGQGFDYITLGLVCGIGMLP